MIDKIKSLCFSDPYRVNINLWILMTPTGHAQHHGLVRVHRCTRTSVVSPGRVFSQYRQLVPQTALAFCSVPRNILINNEQSESNCFIQDGTTPHAGNVRLRICCLATSETNNPSLREHKSPIKSHTPWPECC